jgi:hypothetical protein
MAADSSVSIELRERIERGDESALLELFTSHRERLKRMVKLRLDRRLKGRLDASDVLQEACIDVARRAREYVVQFDQLVSQQSYGPPCSALGCRTTGDGDKTGFLLAIELRCPFC